MKSKIWHAKSININKQKVWITENIYKRNCFYFFYTENEAMKKTEELNELEVNHV